LLNGNCELRRGRKSTYRMRWLLALAGIVLWFLLLISSTSSITEKGQIVFVATGVVALAFGLLAGIFLTADCLSEEKREGTLGLLFLTDLQGYDVVSRQADRHLAARRLWAAGNFSQSSRCLCLMGGVTAGEILEGDACAGHNPFFYRYRWASPFQP